MAKNREKRIEKNEQEGGMVIPVTREKLEATTASGDVMYSYVVCDILNVNGVERKVKAEFGIKNRDIAGYEMLDIIFMLGDVANLTVSNETMLNDDTGEVIEYTTYEIWNKDASTGVRYSYKVRPRAESDKAKLNVIIQQRAIRNKSE